MSEDRTQPPSKRRRQLAREQGQVAHSPELTAAAGWLVAVVAWGIAGNDLASALVGLVRGSMAGAVVMPADPAEYSAWGELLRLSGLEGPGLARAASRLILQLAAVLAGTLLVLGLVDYSLRYFRFEAMLHTTVQEQREDQRAMEGDLASRAHRRRI